MPWLSKNELSVPTFPMTLNYDLKVKRGLSQKIYI